MKRMKYEGGRKMTGNKCKFKVARMSKFFGIKE